ncbi:hypothetical protein GH733_004042 [Mirounga leonina]|nr:hypothetical protein GH733_004042 [Mirounga leonina]
MTFKNMKCNGINHNLKGEFLIMKLFIRHILGLACIPVTNKKPTQASITKVKQFEGSTSFVRRSQWMLEQLRQVNGIDPNRDSAEFDLLFENAFDQWVASTASEKCTFFQILHHTCQRYLTDRKPEFINCQSKIMGGEWAFVGLCSSCLLRLTFT